MPAKPPQSPSKLAIRWMIRRDMEDVLAIERDSFEFPWDEHWFTKCLRQRNCIGMVYDAEKSRDTKAFDIRGFFIYELHKTRLHVLNFAVARLHRRSGIGRAMVEKLKDKLSWERRSRILLEVRETNLSAQLFFRAMGFRAVSVLRDFYEDTSESAILMQYRVEQCR